MSVSVNVNAGDGDRGFDCSDSRTDYASVIPAAVELSWDAFLVRAS